VITQSRADALDTFWLKVNDRSISEAVDLYTEQASVNLVGRVAQGHAAIMEELSTFIEAFPDIVYSVVGRVESDDLVVEEWTASGTQSGPFMGMPPTQRAIHIRAVTLYEFSGNRVTSDRTYLDMSPVLLRTGVVTLVAVSPEPDAHA
jgi:steroid delta-isomerase-like uncharacterized protein